VLFPAACSCIVSTVQFLSKLPLRPGSAAGVEVVVLYGGVARFCFVCDDRQKALLAYAAGLSDQLSAADDALVNFECTEIGC
jgi:hypothetical protein